MPLSTGFSASGARHASMWRRVGRQQTLAPSSATGLVLALLGLGATVNPRSPARANQRPGPTDKGGMS